MAKPILYNDLFLSFYGDDFTGSTDVMETLALNGIPTALFLSPPDHQELQNFRLKVGIGSPDGTNQLLAFGVAGISRSLSPDEMDHELPAIFHKIGRIPVDFFQYKICSTFDSSDRRGNIGYATEIALNQFPSDYIPLIVATPFLNRFVIFGNLFARVNHETYRLDRHPTMSKHPVTPMNESDLRVHLTKQTSRTVKLFDKFSLEGAYGNPLDKLKELAHPSGKYILFDSLEDNHLTTIGELLIRSHRGKTSLLVGASGASYALALYLQKIGKISKVASLPKPGKADQMMVVAGSCAPGTALQIRYFQGLGHRAIRMDTLKLVNPEEQASEISHLVNSSLESIGKGQVPILYTALGPDDPVIEKTHQRFHVLHCGQGDAGLTLAEAQGIIVKEVLNKAGKLRLVVAGGDTSGYVSRILGVYALETLFPVAPGAPLCLAHSQQAEIDGLEISLKGGQNGNEKYFESIHKGGLIN